MRIRIEVGSVGIEIEGDELKLASALKAAVATVAMFIEEGKPNSEEALSTGMGFQIERRPEYDLDGTDAGWQARLG